MAGLCVWSLSFCLINNSLEQWASPKSCRMILLASTSKPCHSLPEQIHRLAVVQRQSKHQEAIQKRSWISGPIILSSCEKKKRGLSIILHSMPIPNLQFSGGFNFDGHVISRWLAQIETTYIVALCCIPMHSLHVVLMLSIFSMQPFLLCILTSTVRQRHPVTLLQVAGRRHGLFHGRLRPEIWWDHHGMSSDKSWVYQATRFMMDHPESGLHLPYL